MTFKRSDDNQQTSVSSEQVMRILAAAYLRKININGVISDCQLNPLDLEKTNHRIPVVITV